MGVGILKACIRLLKQRKIVRVQNESMTLATVSFQNFFRLYKKLSGMKEQKLHFEFQQIYSLDVSEFHRTSPIARIDKKT